MALKKKKAKHDPDILVCLVTTLGMIAVCLRGFPRVNLLKQRLSLCDVLSPNTV